MAETLTTKEVYEVLSLLFPKQNDFGGTGYKSELKELVDFGIETKEQFHDLLTKHKDEIMELDADMFDEDEVEWLAEEFGRAYMEDKVKNKYWFAYQGILRLALELEFGDKYENYITAQNRYGNQ